MPAAAPAASSQASSGAAPDPTTIWWIDGPEALVAR